MATVRVRFMTGFGAIDFELYPDRAPVSVANFLRYVDGKRYDNTSFYRTVTPKNQPDKLVKIEVIQGGPADDAPAFPPIALERTSKTGLKHRDGTLSMARDTPNSATHAVFVCVGDQSELDFGGKRNPDGQGFAAFGKVVAGMETVRKIQKSPAVEQKLTPAIKILTARRLR